jgi:hypothetical protein
MEHLHGIYNYVRQHLKLASDWWKIRYDRLANWPGCYEGYHMLLYRATGTKGKSPKLQSPWDGSYKAVM